MTLLRIINLFYFNVSEIVGADNNVSEGRWEDPS
jgi:hypothetical protein